MESKTKIQIFLQCRKERESTVTQNRRCTHAHKCEEMNRLVWRNDGWVDERSEIKGGMTKEECVHERAGWRTEDRQLMKTN